MTNDVEIIVGPKSLHAKIWMSSDAKAGLVTLNQVRSSVSQQRGVSPLFCNIAAIRSLDGKFPEVEAVALTDQGTLDLSRISVYADLGERQVYGLRLRVPVAADQNVVNEYQQYLGDDYSVQKV